MPGLSAQQFNRLGFISREIQMPAVVTFIDKISERLTCIASEIAYYCKPKIVIYKLLRDLAGCAGRKFEEILGNRNSQR